MVLQGDAAGALRRGGLADRLRKEVRGEVLFDAASRGRYATDASIYQRMPLGVVVPETSLDLRLALEVARDAGVPVLSRGGGTSQCGQTVGEALVIDTSRHLRKMLSLNLEAGEVTVEPGMVLDHLNQALKPHGVWFPVDVSTAAQCTIGGMTGNNSCGSRSLHYGNMVHNVRAIDAILDDGTLARFTAFGDGAEMQLNSQRLRALVSRLHEIAQQVAPEIRALWPKVMRRVGGYNLDIFDPQSERPYTADGRVNLAHLLVGSEGTLATFESIRLALAPIPRAKVLGVVNFPTFQR
ncbi:MAG TPA: FAD-binding oxidoreductase, partial [Burkholderiaceae bacterium]|nr:FAD-binding oxidoreductase [Burkholderiaceae bacterium]